MHHAECAAALVLRWECNPVWNKRIVREEEDRSAGSRKEKVSPSAAVLLGSFWAIFLKKGEIHYKRAQHAAAGLNGIHIGKRGGSRPRVKHRRERSSYTTMCWAWCWQPRRWDFLGRRKLSPSARKRAQKKKRKSNHAQCDTNMPWSTFPSFGFFLSLLYCGSGRTNFKEQWPHCEAINLLCRTHFDFSTSIQKISFWYLVKYQKQRMWLHRFP